MKKVLSVILAVVMLASIFTALPVMAGALDPSGSCGENVTYTFNSSTGKLTISGTGAMGKYFPTTTPFSYATEIKSIVIKNGVTDIGQYMFYHCENVTSVTIPASVTEIKYDAFDNCKALKNIMLPNGVVTIGGQAFCDCDKLESISIPKSVTSVGERAFLGCDTLSKVYYAGTQSEWNKISISNEYNSALTDADKYYDAMGGCGANVTYNINSETKTLTIKGTGAMYDYDKNQSPFANNVAIETIVIKDGVTSIGSYAFMTCAKVKGVNIAPSVTSIGEGAFINCYDLLFAQLPPDVIVIPDKAFNNCKSLTDIGIPATVTTIGEGAFDKCENLWTVYYWGTESQWKSIAKGAYNDQLSKVTVKPFVFSGYCGDAAYYHFFDSTGQLSIDGYGDMYDYPVKYPEYYDNYKDDIKEISVSGVTTVGQAAFYELPNVTYASFDSTVKTISYGAFAKCPSLEYVELPDGLETIKDSAFSECTNLKEIYIPETLTTLGFGAFIDASDDFTVTASCTQTLVNKIIKDTNRKWEKDHKSPLPKANENVVEPTCTDAGSHDDVIKCAACGNDISRVHITDPAPGHEWSTIEVISYATATKVGIEDQECSVCYETRSIYTPPTGKISGFKCTARTASAEKLVWKKVSGSIKGYQVQISNAAGNKWATYKNLKANTNSYVFTKLAAGSNYKFRVRFYVEAPDGHNYFSQWTVIASPTLPANTAFSKLAPAKKAFSSKWTARASASGYQIQYSTNAKFKKAGLKTVKGTKNNSLAVKGLKGNTKYYVRIRTYKTINGKNYFSAWSKAKTVRTKR